MCRTHKLKPKPVVRHEGSSEVLEFQVYTIFLLKFILLFIQKKNDYNFMLIYYMKKLFVRKNNLIGLLKSEKADYAEQRYKCYRISYMNPVE